MRILLLAALALCFDFARAKPQAEMVVYGPSGAQSAARLEGAWKQIPDSQREMIMNCMITRLGLSSTGLVHLIGIYPAEPASPTLLHFQQLDLLGTRLFWSALVNPEAMSMRVLYHVDETKVSNTFHSVSSCISIDAPT